MGRMVQHPNFAPAFYHPSSTSFKPHSSSLGRVVWQPLYDQRVTATTITYCPKSNTIIFDLAGGISNMFRLAMEESVFEDEPIMDDIQENLWLSWHDPRVVSQRTNLHPTDQPVEKSIS